MEELRHAGPHVTNPIDALLQAVDRGYGAYFLTDAQEGTLKNVIDGLRDAASRRETSLSPSAWPERLPG